MKKPSQQERMSSLEACISYVPEAFTITYLFYRVAHGQPAITWDPDFSLRDYVRTF